MLGSDAIGAVRMPMRCLCDVSHHHAPLWARWRRRPCTNCHSPCLRRCSCGGGGPFLPCPHLYVPWNSVSLGGHSGGFIPLGKFFHSRGFNALRRLESPSPSLTSPPGVFRLPGGLTAPLPAPHSQGITAQVFLSANNPLPYPWYRPIATFCSRLVCGCRGDIPGVAPAILCAPR